MTDAEKIAYIRLALQSDDVEYWPADLDHITKEDIEWLARPYLTRGAVRWLVGWAEDAYRQLHARDPNEPAP